MYFIIREGEIYAGPFESMKEARGVEGCQNGDELISSDYGRIVGLITTNGNWEKIRHPSYVGYSLREEMHSHVSAREKANAISRRSEAERPLAVDMVNVTDEAKRHQGNVWCPGVTDGGHIYIDGICVACGRAAEDALGTDMVNAPPHYNQAGIECIDAIAAATSGKTGIQAVCVANVIKYLWRYELKNGVEDVKKARWYLDRLIGGLDK